MNRSTPGLRTAILGVACSVIVYVAAMFWTLLSAAPGPLQAIRRFAWHDQLGYLSMVVDVADGNLTDREPVTESGVNHYPRAYYTVVGLVARIFHLEPITAWNAVSLLFQIAAVAALSICLIRLSRRPWAGFLAPLPFFAGVLSFAAPDGEGWYRPLDSHAVLWGPYGALFSNNAETAGLCTVIVSTSALAAVWLRPTSRPARVMTSALALLALGALSSFQTYSFLAGAYVVAYAAAALFLVRAGRRGWVVATLAALLAVFVAGPHVASAAGQLPTLVFGLLPAVPGLVRGLIRTRGVLAVYAVAFCVTAAPQILWTLSGIRRQDPFLTYRVASNVDLGVARPDALLAATVVALPLVAVLVVSVRRRAGVPAAIALAAAAVWIVLSLNDVWGANAEPYRFWIDCFLLCGVLTVIAGASLIGRTPPVRSSEDPRIDLLPAVLAGACVIVYAAGLVDFARFTSDPDMQETWNPQSPRAAAISEMARSTVDTDSRRLLVDSCVDDRTVKATSGASMPFYYLGMAWPENRDAMQAVMDARFRSLPITADQADAAGIGWVLLDSACVAHTGVIGEPGTLVDQRTYGEGLTLQLRRLP